MQLSPEAIKTFQQYILNWFAANKRDLPWRRTRDPYSILISEVMLQQTQVSRVLPKYQLWLERFPTLTALAQASSHAVLSMWSGLGYNRRALYLQKAANEIVERYDGVFPGDEAELRKLPGIGVYTARAVLCFAFDRQIAVVDTNVRRVILTQFQMSNGKSQISHKEVQAIADTVLPVGKAYEWNQALMDYASAMLKKEKIPIKKQSRFKDSDRYYRGQIIKLLIAQGQVAREELFHSVKKESGCTPERFEKILEGLVKDELIIGQGKSWKIR